MAKRDLPKTNRAHHEYISATLKQVNKCMPSLDLRPYIINGLKGNQV